MTASVVKVINGTEIIWFPSVSSALAERVVNQINQSNMKKDRSYKVIYHKS
ncbi:hypothetical protein [Paenibacillus periandrae]|uniref:hypothetical protein n=1 Tax=Paenibacillus periandrae TaxID=1761741 RepID=UPI001F090CD0|nr:hypothetical protein [Paenibacillus periandrae]